MEFADLNDEIVADDWQIPREEISKKRLIRQTPRYNIYKADWFGDVLVYEPVRRDGTSKKELTTKRSNHRAGLDRFNQEELSSRLNQLNLNLNEQSLSVKLKLAIDCDQNDSAYSSISSTPLCHTKKKSSEFEFPSRLSSPSLSSIGSSFTYDSMSSSFKDTSSVTIGLKCQNRYSNSERQPKKAETFKSGPVILNLESFTTVCNSKLANKTASKGTWSELNELRLVAHESFMLFMGASMDCLSSSSENLNSLVIQMNHPKAMSLYDLLHTVKFTSTSTRQATLERLFPIKQQSRPLSFGAKLNICQQVTNGMTYLHDKNIVHGRLTSVNIYIEPNQRVKISLIDNEDNSLAALSPDDGQDSNSIVFNIPSLTYLSPELIKTMDIIIEPDTLVNIITDQLTKKSDIFSFGTLLFELFEEKFPFSSEYHVCESGKFTSPYDISSTNCASNEWNGNITASAQEIIHHISSGQMRAKNLGNFRNSKYHPLVEEIISACWSTDPIDRPNFKQLTF